MYIERVQSIWAMACGVYGLRRFEALVCYEYSTCMCANECNVDVTTYVIMYIQWVI